MKDLIFIVFSFLFVIIGIILFPILWISDYISRRNYIKERREEIMEETKDWEKKIDRLTKKYSMEVIEGLNGVSFYMYGRHYAIIATDGATEVVGKIDEETLKKYFSDRVKWESRAFYNPDDLLFLDLALVDEDGKINFIEDVEKHIRGEFNIPDDISSLKLRQFINQKIVEITNEGKKLKEMAESFLFRPRAPIVRLDHIKEFYMLSFTHVSFGLSYVYMSSWTNKRIVKIVAPDKIPMYLRPRMGDEYKINSELKVETREPLVSIPKHEIVDYYKKAKGLSYNKTIGFEEIIETDEFERLIVLIILGILNAFDALPFFVQSYKK